MGKIVYDGFHKVEELEIDIKDKKRKIKRLGINHAVAGIVCDADNKIALVVQYRPCVVWNSSRIAWQKRKLTRNINTGIRGRIRWNFKNVKEG